MPIKSVAISDVATIKEYDVLPSDVLPFVSSTIPLPLSINHASNVIPSVWLSGRLSKFAPMPTQKSFHWNELAKFKPEDIKQLETDLDTLKPAMLAHVSIDFALRNERRSYKLFCSLVERQISAGRHAALCFVTVPASLPRYTADWHTLQSGDLFVISSCADPAWLFQAQASPAQAFATSKASKPKVKVQLDPVDDLGDHMDFSSAPSPKWWQKPKSEKQAQALENHRDDCGDDLSGLGEEFTALSAHKM